MLVLFARTPRPEAAYWPGRVSLAVLDALAWPLLWIAAVAGAPRHTGLLGVVVMALAATLALGRVRCAIWQNERYRFATWRWGRPLLALIVFGWTVKALLS